MGGLESQLQPDVMMLRQNSEQIKHSRIQAVGACGYAETDDTGRLQGFVIETFQQGKGSIGITVCLEVSQVAVTGEKSGAAPFPRGVSPRFSLRH
jgi:hypothetical protein